MMDVLVPCNGTSTWCVLQANGSGFTGPTNTTTPSTGFNNQVLAADLDGDGRDDLVRIMNTQSLGVRLRGATTFGSESTAYGPIAFTFITGDFAQMKAMKFRSLKRRMDFNGDSRQDFVLKMRYDEGPGGNILDYIGTFFGGGSAITTGGNVGTTLLPELAGDFNGDGLTDLYFFTASTTYARLAKGTGFSSNVAGPPATGLVGLSALALDHDGDGMDDLVVAKSSPSSWHLSRSTGNGFATLTNLSLSGWSTSHRAADFNGDGLVDMVGPGADTKFRAHEGVYPDLLDRVTDGFGMYVDFNYAPLTAGAPTYTKGSGAGFPTIDYQGPLYVVSSTSSTDGIGGTYSTTFKYEQARHHYQGRGFLGFGKFISTDSRNSISTEQTEPPRLFRRRSGFESGRHRQLTR